MQKITPAAQLLMTAASLSTINMLVLMPAAQQPGAGALTQLLAYLALVLTLVLVAAGARQWRAQ